MRARMRTVRTFKHYLNRLAAPDFLGRTCFQSVLRLCLHFEHERISILMDGKLRLHLGWSGTVLE